MAILSNLLSFRNTKKVTGVRETIKVELDEYQKILESLGFKVKRSDRLVNFEAAHSMIAERGNVVLRATRFWQGGKDLSITLNHDGLQTTVPLFPYKFEQAVAVVNAAQYLTAGKRS